ncbi:hypothetical protein GCM10010228_60430 [Streptomyces massasporeus]|nr:hypothetical protein GCM10010228_60430 [Streptomyces massasporeus]
MKPNQIEQTVASDVYAYMRDGGVVPRARTPEFSGPTAPRDGPHPAQTPARPRHPRGRRTDRDGPGRGGRTNLADRPFDRLSGGERRRVLIARVLAQRSSLLVLDEPTNRLDIRHQLDVPVEILTSRLLAEVYGVTSEVARHPRTGAPQVTFLPCPIQESQLLDVTKPQVTDAASWKCQLHVMYSGKQVEPTWRCLSNSEEPQVRAPS